MFSVCSKFVTAVNIHYVRNHYLARPMRQQTVSSEATWSAPRGYIFTQLVLEQDDFLNNMYFTR